MLMPKNVNAQKYKAQNHKNQKWGPNTRNREKVLHSEYSEYSEFKDVSLRM